MKFAAQRSLASLAAPACAAAAWVLFASSISPAAEAGQGSIKGQVVWGGDSAPERKELQPKGGTAKDPVCAKNAAILADNLVVDPKTKGVRNVVVYLLKPKATNPEAVKALVAKAAKVDIDQKNCRFIPHVTAIHQDQGIVFKSSDATNHNIRYSSFKNGADNKLLPPNGQMEVKFVADRPIQLKCDIHPWMEGYVTVFDHPFFAVTGEDGTFEIKGVPDGTYNVVAWHDSGYVGKGAARGTPVTIDSGKDADLGLIKLDPARVK